LSIGFASWTVVFAPLSLLLGLLSGGDSSFFCLT
jgi:hypothetical protein